MMFLSDSWLTVWLVLHQYSLLEARLYLHLDVLTPCEAQFIEQETFSCKDMWVGIVQFFLRCHPALLLLKWLLNSDNCTTYVH